MIEYERPAGYSALGMGAGVMGGARGLGFGTALGGAFAGWPGTGAIAGIPALPASARAPRARKTAAVRGKGKAKGRVLKSKGPSK